MFNKDVFKQEAPKNIRYNTKGKAAGALLLLAATAGIGVVNHEEPAKPVTTLEHTVQPGDTLNKLADQSLPEDASQNEIYLQKEAIKASQHGENNNDPNMLEISEEVGIPVYKDSEMHEGMQNADKQKMVGEFPVTPVEPKQ